MTPSISGVTDSWESLLTVTPVRSLHAYPKVKRKKAKNCWQSASGDKAEVMTLLLTLGSEMDDFRSRLEYRYGME